MTSNTVFAFIALAACIFSLSTVLGMPSDLDSFNQQNITLHRNARQLIDTAITAGQAIAGGVSAALNSPACTRGGCSKGYCWAYCHAVLGHEREWCYTTRGSSQNYQYVSCSRDEDCDKCWKCAGSCAVGF